MLPSTQENELLEQNTLLPQQQQEKKNNPWVETRARAGNFGAPVLFEDVPENTSQEDLSEQALNEETLDLAESHLIETTTKEPEHIKSPELEENITNTQEDVPEIQSLQKEEKITETEQLPLNMVNKAIETNNVVFNAATQPQPPVTAQKATPRRTPQPQLSPPKKPSPRPSTAQTKPDAFSNPKPPITLAQLTQGFLHHRKEQSGSYGISMLGIKRGIPSEEQMRYERYLQKLVWCLQNSFNINRYKQPAISSDAPVHVFFSLNRDGILQHLSIKKSSGNMYIDQFVLFIFQDASSSFPPVPSYLTDNPFSMTCVVS